MSDFATLDPSERRMVIEEAAARSNLVPVIVEKDFWVTWLLGQIFQAPGLEETMVFKGGTSLSKVFHAIERFSEDIDLCLVPSSLGIDEADLNDAPSRTQREKRMQLMADACADRVVNIVLPALAASIDAALGAATDREPWLRFEIDPVAATPNLWFRYPSVLSQPGGYIAKQVKLEIGSLTNQRPAGGHRITAFIAGALGEDAYDDLAAEVVALEFERTFWEKATILHAEFSRPAEQPVRDRFARHYADFGRLWEHPLREAALARRDLRDDVALHKGRFFSSSWARYDLAQPPTFRLVPPEHRLRALERDYVAMRPMFMTEPPSFAALIGTLAEAESAINTI